MQSYEVVREVENQCANNQMRDIFFEEIETDDPVGWLRGFVKGRDVEMSVDKKENSDLTVCFLHIFMQFLQKWACLCRNFVLRYFCIESAEGRAPRTRRNFIILEASYERCGNL